MSFKGDLSFEDNIQMTVTESDRLLISKSARPLVLDNRSQPKIKCEH